MYIQGKHKNTYHFNSSYYIIWIKRYLITVSLTKRKKKKLVHEIYISEAQCNYMKKNYKTFTIPA